jgi:hypothetical protein
MPMKPINWVRALLAGILVLGLTQSAACSGPPAAGTPAAHGRRTGVRLQEEDGGPDYYSRFSPSFPADPSFFPVGVWLAAVNQESEITSDQAAGLNTYVALTDNSDFGLVASSDMYLISNKPPAEGNGTVGWFVSDEADMWGGPGSGAATGSGCLAAASCGYTVQRKVLSELPDDHRLRFANYGKGVIFWENDSQAARFVDDYQNIVSDDVYWFTDESVCLSAADAGWYPGKLVKGTLPPQLCHLAANYGRTVDRVRQLAKDKEPVWAYIELGHPFTENNWPSITPQQVAAAVWQSLISGARGIIYFNNSFGGPCVTGNVLRDPCYAQIRAAVTAVDSEIRSLAPVLNAPFADGVVEASTGVNISTKWYGGHFYVLAGSAEPAAQTVTFSMPCVGSATVAVLNEHRTIHANHGVFEDRFANGNAVHIYRIDGGSSCGA